jgi:hypothetical protein
MWDGATATYTRPDASGGTVSGLAVGNEVDVLQMYGAGTSRGVASIASAIRGIGSNNATLVFAPGTWSIDANLTIPANCTCHIPAGCIFSIDSGKTLTFAGRVLTESDTWFSGSGSVSVPGGLQGGVYFRTALEVSNGVTVVRYNFRPGVLKRYTTDDGSGADISTAFEAMLASGEKICYVDAPNTTWGISTQIDWVSGVSVVCGRGTSFTSGRASGQWAFKFSAIPYGAGASFVGFILNVTNAGSHGIQIWESRNVYIDVCEVRGPAGIGGTAIEINGGDDNSATWGAAHNVIGDNVMCYRMAAAVRLYTDNTTTPSSNTAFANRNRVGRVHANNCTEGLSIDRANTNLIEMSLQSNTEGADIGQYAKNNEFNLQLESNTRPIVLNTSADDNIFGGNVKPTDFVDSGGVAVLPHVSTTVVGTNTFQLPRDMDVSSGGGIRLRNSYASAALRIRADDTYDQDLIIGSHDAADTNWDLLAWRYDASDPYLELIAARTLRLGAASRIRWATVDRQATVGAAGGASALPATPSGYLKVNFNGTDVVVPYYAIS